jgi:hypothetical protein
MSVCGWLLDAETDALIGTVSDEWSDCDGLTPRPTTGPCALEVRLYDALMFAGNPTGTPPLMPERLTINTCGQFIAENVAAPALGFVAIAVDDEPTGANQHWLSAALLPAMANIRNDRVVAYAVRRTSNESWTASAGNPFGASTFGERGTYLHILSHRGLPAAGATVTVGGSPAEAFYFSDPGLARTTIDANQTSTGANGSALVIGADLGNLSAEGGIPLGDACIWPDLLGAAIPGVFLVQRSQTVDAMENVCE